MAIANAKLCFNLASCGFGNQTVDQTLIRCPGAGEERGGRVSSEDEGAPATVVLVPGKPADFTIAELTELATAVSTETEIADGVVDQRSSAPLTDVVLHATSSSARATPPQRSSTRLWAGRAASGAGADAKARRLERASSRSSIISKVRSR